VQSQGRKLGLCRQKLQGRSTLPKLSKAVDAGAPAGAQDLPSQASARTVATNDVALNVRPSAPETNVTFPASNTIRVSANYYAPSFFANVIGVMRKDVDNVTMRQVAESTEGHFYSAPDNDSLKVACSDIAAKSYIRLTYVH